MDIALYLGIAGVIVLVAANGFFVATEFAYVAVRRTRIEQLAENGTDRHKFIHTLLLCYESEWHNLIFVKRRESNHIEHWSQYDELHGNES